MSTDFEVMVPPEGADSGATQKGMLSATAAANSGQVNAALAYLATLHSPQSRKSVASKLNVFARWTGAADLRDCRWGEMKTEHVLAGARRHFGLNFELLFGCPQGGRSGCLARTIDGARGLPSHQVPEAEAYLSTTYGARAFL